MLGTDDRNHSAHASAAEWLVGGGEMGELIRATDWSQTPFGPRDRWPLVLRTVVRLVVENQFPMVLLWGRELRLLYNDAYRAILGGKHPLALGRSTREVWAEAWHLIEPILASVLDSGEPVYLEDQLYTVERHGHREDAYFTLCYSPVRAEDGTIAGTLVTVIETTHSEGEDRGSDFTVALPLQEPPMLDAAPEPKRSSSRRRVLVIEDNVDAAESLREVLELDDYDVAVAYSGTEGVAAARRYKPDVIFCDIGLPELDGFGVARTLRADPDPGVHKTFLVALTGYALQEDVAKSKAAGFDRHMAKPPNIEALERLIAEAPPRAASYMP